MLDPDVSFDTAGKSLGLYTDTLTFIPTSSNTSGVTDLAPIELDLRAQVIPEPTTVALLGMSAMLLGLRRKRYA